MPGPAHLVPACYTALVHLAAPFVPKARAWVEGRRGLWKRLEAKAPGLHGCIWMHCASVGEFEQGRPVLEALHAAHPHRPILVTFFSPSGYEARKDLPMATHVEHLPADTPANAARFVDLVRPAAVLWVKYEFWPNMLHALRKAGTPTFLVSAIFRARQPFFRCYGQAWRAMLRCFTHVFAQDDASGRLLTGIGMEAVSVSGDTRFDRVLAIAGGGEPPPPVPALRGDGPTLLCGSTWPADEEVLRKALEGPGNPPRCIVVPHELSDAGLRATEARFPGPVVRWAAPAAGAATLLVDRMGLLARLYAHADVAYVGGGFSDGVHSLLEPAAWGVPVIFGPRHTKFAEAAGLIAAGGGFAVNDAAGLRTVLRRLLDDPAARQRAGEAAARYVRDHAGATARVVARVDAALRDAPAT